MEKIRSIWSKVLEQHYSDTAIKDINGTYTYGELNNAANELSKIIKSTYLGDIPLIGVRIPEGYEYVVAVLAVLKCGLGFVPIDILCPQKRMAAIVEQCGISIILGYSDGKYVLDKPVHKEKPLLVQDDLNGEIAYVLYTSGTTGIPKGIMVSVDNLINLTKWFGKKYHIDNQFRIIQLARTTFDVSIEEIFGCIFNGGILFIPEAGVRNNKGKIRQYIKDNEITMVQGVPMQLREYFQDEESISSLKIIISGGEALGEKLKNDLLDQGYELYNNYGLTETTVDAFCCKCTKDEDVNLGRCIEGCDYYILDENNREIVENHDGGIGELYIYGANLALGYVDKKENQGRFFVYKGKRVYRTGDFVRLENNKLIFLGRKDGQIKRAGKRVELEEIENVFRNITGIDICIATEYNSSIILFYERDIPYNDQSIDEEMKKKLPDYMLPARIVHYSRLPLNDNGKIDKNLLLTEYSNKYDTAKGENLILTPIEKKVLAIASDILKEELDNCDVLKPIMEIGINSISFVSMIVEIEDEYDIEIEDKMLTITAFNTLRDISDYVQTLVSTV